MISARDLMYLRRVARQVGYTVEKDSERRLYVCDEHEGDSFSYDDVGYQAALSMLRQVREAKEK